MEKGLPLLFTTLLASFGSGASDLGWQTKVTRAEDQSAKLAKLKWDAKVQRIDCPPGGPMSFQRKLNVLLKKQRQHPPKIAKLVADAGDYLKKSYCKLSSEKLLRYIPRVFDTELRTSSNPIETLQKVSEGLSQIQKEQLARFFVAYLRDQKKLPKFKTPNQKITHPTGLKDALRKTPRGEPDSAVIVRDIYRGLFSAADVFARHGDKSSMVVTVRYPGGETSFWQDIDKLSAPPAKTARLNAAGVWQQTNTRMPSLTPEMKALKKLKSLKVTPQALGYNSGKLTLEDTRKDLKITYRRAKHGSKPASVGVDVVFDKMAYNYSFQSGQHTHKLNFVANDHLTFSSRFLSDRIKDTAISYSKDGKEFTVHPLTTEEESPRYKVRVRYPWDEKGLTFTVAVNSKWSGGGTRVKVGAETDKYCIGEDCETKASISFDESNDVNTIELGTSGTIGEFLNFETELTRSDELSGRIAVNWEKELEAAMGESLKILLEGDMGFGGLETNPEIRSYEVSVAIEREAANCWKKKLKIFHKMAEGERPDTGARLDVACKR